MKPEIQRFKKKVITEGLKRSAAFSRHCFYVVGVTRVHKCDHVKQSSFNVLYVQPVLGGIREPGKSKWFLFKF